LYAPKSATCARWNATVTTIACAPKWCSPLTSQPPDTPYVRCSTLAHAVVADGA
jgi:hypothetical protein